MDYFLTEEQIMIRDLARQIAEEKIVPVRAELDETGKFPWDIMKTMAQSDLFGLFIPEEYGGLGKGCLELCIAVEELSRACLGVSTSYAANALGDSIRSSFAPCCLGQDPVGPPGDGYGPSLPRCVRPTVRFAPQRPGPQDQTPSIPSPFPSTISATSAFVES